MANSFPIGIFDSGVGQLSILKKIEKLLPNESCVILADEKHLPFGEKSKQSIEKYTSDAADYLIKSYKIKLLVVACNTASVHALVHIRKEYQIPIVGTVPAIKPAFLKSKNKNIAVLATKATINSDYLQNLLNIYAPGAKILKIVCSGLEDAIEKHDKNKINGLIKIYTQKISAFKSDCVVLACTHYPLVQASFKKLLPKGMIIVDSSQGIAKKVRSDLINLKQLSDQKKPDVYLTTGDAQQFSRSISHYLKRTLFARKIEL